MSSFKKKLVCKKSVLLFIANLVNLFTKVLFVSGQLLWTLYWRCFLKQCFKTVKICIRSSAKIIIATHVISLVLGFLKLLYKITVQNDWNHKKMLQVLNILKKVNIFCSCVCIWWISVMFPLFSGLVCSPVTVTAGSSC